MGVRKSSPRVTVHGAVHEAPHVHAINSVLNNLRNKRWPSNLLITVKPAQKQQPKAKESDQNSRFDPLEPLTFSASRSTEETERARSDDQDPSYAGYTFFGVHQHDTYDAGRPQDYAAQEYVYRKVGYSASGYKCPLEDWK